MKYSCCTYFLPTVYEPEEFLPEEKRDFDRYASSTDIEPGGDTSAAPRPAGKVGAGPKMNHEIDATKKNLRISLGCRIVLRHPKNVAAL